MMRLCADVDVCDVDGVALVSDENQAWKLKKQAVNLILESLCTLIKQQEKADFFCLYWAIKTHGTILMDFKDLKQALKVFRQLKYECQENQMFRHKMQTYK